MFKKAAEKETTSPLALKATAQQRTLLSSFRHTGSTQQTSTARPLSVGSTNIIREPDRRTSAGYGAKRTSSGLVKALGSQENFDYPALSIPQTGTNATRTSVGSTNTSKVPVEFDFDENDFDSDIDLDVEELQAKDTVQYPTLPQTSKDHKPRDSGYGSVDIGNGLVGLDSSQPIPWSSSPVEHFQPPPTRPAQPTKRRTLPWLDKGSQIESTKQSEASPEPEPLRPKKRRLPEGKLASDATPKPKDAKSEYPWNTTASAVKQQQKSLREAKKALTKTNGVDEEERKKAIAQKKKNTVHRIFLSEEQQHVLQLVTEYKKSVFFTGSAGTGKSVLLREIISALRRKYIREPDRIAVTASTGLAACNIGGVTLHSFAGIGLGQEPAEELVKKVRRHNTARQRWLRTKVLIIDEISMVDGDLFDKLEQVARTIRNNGRPFGGIQLIITGDFFQLPPVGERGRAAKFAFDAGTWTTTIEHTIGLHHVFRQKDPVFAGMLNEMREGRMTSESIAKFKSLERPLPRSEENIEATELFPTRAEVDRANNLRMQQLHGDIMHFEARDGGTITDKTMRDKLLDKCMAPQTVSLKKGAQVMLIKNMDDTLVNGSLGKVIGFMTEQMFNIYKENEEAFLEGRDVEGPSEQEIRAQQKASLLGVNTQQLYPLVRFSLPDGTTRDLLCKREPWKYEQPNGEVQASREQIPLILAWALSIHKAQGQTLERVRVDLGKAFEKGQAYVALSRATSMAGLQVMRFDASKVRAHEKVRAFYSSLSRAEHANEQSKKNTVLGKLMKNKKEATTYEEDFVNA